MMENRLEIIRDTCIECGRCTKNCDFLNKYGMDVKKFTEREELRYSCFMCGKCEQVCPKKLSGAEVARILRTNDNSSHVKVKWMKNPYIFRNTHAKKSTQVLHLGCNYPGVYPKTVARLIEIGRSVNVDFMVDCCQKPLYELGVATEYGGLERRLEEKETSRLICACPNCYHLLKKKLKIEVISVFQFLHEAGIGQPISEHVNIFFPCSDRYSKEIFSHIRPYLKDFSPVSPSVNCCGLGGGASKKEPDLLKKTEERLKKLGLGNIYSYCSSCSLIFSRYGLKGNRNLLSEILGVSEEVSSHYLRNVLKFKFHEHK